MSRCELCDAYDPVTDQHGHCRAKAPTAFPIGMQQGNVMGGTGQRAARPIVLSIFPEVGKNLWCREFNPREDDGPRLERKLETFSFDAGNSGDSLPIGHKMTV